MSNDLPNEGTKELAVHAHNPYVEFGLKTLQEAAVAFVVTFGTVDLASSTGLGKTAAIAGVVAGVRAVIGVVVKDVGEKNTPHL